MITDEEKQGLIAAIGDYLKGKKTYLMGAVVVLAAVAWIGSGLLSYYSSINPVFATWIQQTADFAGKAAVGLGLMALRAGIEGKKGE